MIILRGKKNIKVQNIVSKLKHKEMIKKFSPPKGNQCHTER